MTDKIPSQPQLITAGAIDCATRHQIQPSKSPGPLPLLSSSQKNLMHRNTIRQQITKHAAVSLAEAFPTVAAITPDSFRISRT
jgi:hypothetical protein